jgi:KaiC/GvpD/RAD55 family RecA-like ATPase
VRKIGAKRLVIDTLTSLVPPEMTSGQAFDFFRQLFNSLEDNLGCTVLLLCRPTRIDPQGSYDAARSLASGIIDLRLVRRGGDLVRTLCVRKMRGTALELAERSVAMERGIGLSVVTRVAAPEVTDIFRRPRALADAVHQPSDSPEAV